jgi:TolB protein
MKTLLALAALVVATTGLAAATPPAKNGRIAFVRLTGAQTSEIFVVNADGTGEQRIAQPPAGYRDDLPDWSPGGSRIVFQRCAVSEGACLIWSANADGTGPRRLSPGCPSGTACADDRSAVYSPGGRRIAFVRTKSKPVLMLADAKLRRVRRVPGLRSFRGSPYSVGWSPNGRRLVFASVNAVRRAVYVVGANGKGLKRLTPWSLEAGGRPDWSPDGKRILFRSYSNRLGGVGVNLYTVRPNGTGLVQLTHFQSSERVLGGSYSPDGRSVAVSTTDILVMRADGTGSRAVTRSESWEISPDWGPRP